MFENIRLITKKDNKICDPDLSWTIKSRIHCCCELNLGMSDKLVWSPGNSIPLNKLIEFYNMLAYGGRSARDIDDQYSFLHNGAVISFLGIQKESAFTIRYKHHNIDMELLRKPFWKTSTWDYHKRFYLKVMAILTQHVSEEVCVKTGALFFKENDHNHDFKIGHKVKTIPGANVKTERTGHVIGRGYHFERSKNIYLLMVNGEAYDKWYFPDDLKRYNAAE